MYDAKQFFSNVRKSLSYLLAKMMHECKKIVTPRRYNAEADNFNWYLERGHDAVRFVDFSELAQAKTPEERFVWLVNTGHLPGAYHQLKAAREMKLDFARVDWSKVDPKEMSIE